MGVAIFGPNVSIDQRKQIVKKIDLDEKESSDEEEDLQQEEKSLFQPSEATFTEKVILLEQRIEHLKKELEDDEKELVQLKEHQTLLLNSALPGNPLGPSLCIFQRNFQKKINLFSFFLLLRSLV